MGMGGGFTARRGSFGQYGSSLYGLDRRPYDSRFTGTTVAAGFAEIRCVRALFNGLDRHCVAPFVRKRALLLFVRAFAPLSSLRSSIHARIRLPGYLLLGRHQVNATGPKYAWNSPVGSNYQCMPSTPNCNQAIEARARRNPPQLPQSRVVPAFLGRRRQ